MKLKIVIYLVVFFLCGTAIGVWFGQRTSPGAFSAAGCRPPSHAELDLFYTDVLNVSSEQKSQITEIEKNYQINRERFTKRMHLANMKLADVIEREGYESAGIQPLVTEIHAAMGELQTLSLTHLAAIEEVLEPKQASLLMDNAVARLRQN